MTQLDSITWFVQVFWLFIIFFVIYFLLYRVYGPLSFYNQNLKMKKIESHYNMTVFYNFLNVSERFKKFFIINNNF